MLRLACLILCVWSTSGFAPSITDRQPHRAVTPLHSYRVNYVVPDTINMEAQRQAMLDQFNALRQQQNGQVVEPATPASPVETTVPAPAPPVVQQVAAPAPAPVASLPEPTFAPVTPVMAPFAPPQEPVLAPVTPVMTPVASPQEPVLASVAPVMAPVTPPVAAPVPVAAPAPVPPAVVTTTVSLPRAPPQTIFEQRNDYILRAAAAGKSRWGSFEVERTKYQTGLRQALALLNGSSATTANAATVSLFEKRNQQILSAAAAGKSRWGKLEVEKTKYEAGLKQAMATLSAV